MNNIALKKLTSNAGAMMLSQFAVALMPLLLTPYLARIFGVREYGIYAFGLSFIQISVICTDYGFGLSAVYKIAKVQNNMNKVREVVGAVYTCKILICILAVIVLCLYPLIQPSYSDEYAFFCILSLAVIGQTLQPVWLFLGLERMWKITAYVVASRVSYLVLTLLFVKSQDDLELAAFFNGGTQLLAAILGLYFVYKAGAWPKWVSFKYVYNIFRSSTEYFGSQISITMYGQGAVFFLGTFATPSQVATYSVAEQFYRGATAIYMPLTSALYPSMAKSRDVSFFKKVFSISVLIALLGVSIGLIFGDWIIGFVFGKAYSDSYKVLVIFMFAIAAAIPSMLLGYPFLGAMGNEKAANRSVILGGVIQVFAFLVLYSVGIFSTVAVVSTVLLAEICVLSWRAKFAFPYFK